MESRRALRRRLLCILMPSCWLSSRRLPPRTSDVSGPTCTYTVISQSKIALPFNYPPIRRNANSIKGEKRT